MISDFSFSQYYIFIIHSIYNIIARLKKENVQLHIHI